jgi:hypothetical protein
MIAAAGVADLGACAAGSGAIMAREGWGALLGASGFIGLLAFSWNCETSCTLNGWSSEMICSVPLIAPNRAER